MFSKNQLKVITKRADETGMTAVDPVEKVDKKKKKKVQGSRAFPQFDRSVVNQLKKSPAKAGLQRGAGSGALGAVLGALAVRMLSKNPKHVGAGAGVGGVLGGVAGYQSGKRQAESDYSRLLFLRRLGVSRLGELETIMKYPELANRVTAKGVKI